MKSKTFFSVLIIIISILFLIGCEPKKPEPEKPEPAEYKTALILAIKSHSLVEPIIKSGSNDLESALKEQYKLEIEPTVEEHEVYVWYYKEVPGTWMEVRWEKKNIFQVTIQIFGPHQQSHFLVNTNNKAVELTYNTLY